METLKLRPYQVQAIDAIQEAIEREQKHMVVEMPAGFGKSIVFAKTIEKINELNKGRILVLARTVVIKEQIERELSTNYQGLIQIERNCIDVETQHRMFTQYAEKISEYQVVIFYDGVIQKEIYETFSCDKKMVVVFSTIGTENINTLFEPKEIVFSYTYQQALDDGYITPAMDVRVLGLAFEAFARQLMEKFGYKQNEQVSTTQEHSWDFIVKKEGQKIWGECKNYKNQVVSPSAANSLLNTLVLQKMKQKIPQEDIILLMVTSKIPSFQKDVIFSRYRIVVWDIENLVYYSKNDPALLKQLSQITYFPIDYVEGRPFEEADLTKLFIEQNGDNLASKAKEEADATEELIRRLIDCETGQACSGEYENICEEILRNLFEANYFNRLTRQHKTKDEHFRMDLIGSLKTHPTTEDGLHPLWRMLTEHYNSHFIVFEFKNYKDEIDQNLIYITEKYLFAAALRNVAIIISRKGFSESAKFAAEGCLKEHGKLILGISDEDLVEMLKLRSDKAADYLLGKLEDFLMGISK